MDIFEFALENEKLGQEYYQKLAGQAPDEGLKNIFEMLAAEEAEHFKIISRMKDNETAEVVESDVISSAKDYFNSVRGLAESFNFEIGTSELYQTARDNEQRDMEYYLEKSEEVDDSAHKAIFKKLAREEKKHYVLLDNLCEFVTKPDTFLEDAEFFNTDEL